MPYINIENLLEYLNSEYQDSTFSRLNLNFDRDVNPSKEKSEEMCVLKKNLIESATYERVLYGTSHEKLMIKLI